jgi:hypothetical protein
MKSLAMLFQRTHSACGIRKKMNLNTTTSDGIHV